MPLGLGLASPVTSTCHRSLSRAAATFPAGAKQIRLARRPKFGWRWRETFLVAAEFGATS